MIPSIAVAIPVALVQHSAESHRQENASSDLLEGLRKKEHAAHRKCLTSCWVVIQNVSLEYKRELVIQAAKDFSIIDSDQIQSEDYFPMLIAQNILSITNSDGRMVAIPEKIMRAGRLSRNEEGVQQSLSKYVTLEDFQRESITYAANDFIANQLLPNQTNADSVFRQCIPYVSELKPPLLNSRKALFDACSTAYCVFSKKTPPQTIEDTWNQALSSRKN